jgi:hypothetical protein
MTLMGMSTRALYLLDFIALTESGQFPFIQAYFTFKLHSIPPSRSFAKLYNE